MKNNKIICSNEHFSKLLTKFKKISNRVINDLSESDFYFLIEYHLAEYDDLEKELFNNYKRNPIKTKSVIVSDRTEMGTKFYLSYTFEDVDGKRSSKNKDNIVFRIYIKIGNMRKKRLVKWNVQINWK